MPESHIVMKIFTMQNIIIALLVIVIFILLIYARLQYVVMQQFKRETEYENWDLRDQNINLRKQLIQQLLARNLEEIILRNPLYFFDKYKNLIKVWKHLERDEKKIDHKWRELTLKYPTVLDFTEYGYEIGNEVAMAYNFIEREQTIEDLWECYQDIKLYESILIKKTSDSDRAVAVISEATLEAFTNYAKLETEQNNK